MKLYVMSCGRIRCRKNIYIPDADKSEYVDAPMPVFLITHPGGNVLFDTGPNPEVFEDPAGVWGGLAKAFQPIGDKDSGVVAQLNTIGISPDDVKYVFNSHLHFDHVGGNRFFPNATFLVSAMEVECARRPELEGKGYFSADWDIPLNYRQVKGKVDIFSDGKIIIHPFPGHTPGHQGLLVRLDRQGPIILAGDSIPCKENFEQRVISKNNLDNEEARMTIDRMHQLVAKEKGMVIYGHDQNQWEDLKKPPLYYD